MLFRCRSREWLLCLLALLCGASWLFPGAAQSAPLDVVLVLDQSGSMKQNDPQRLLVSAASDFIGKLGAQDAAGLVLFGTQAKASFAVTPLTPESNRTALLEEIQRIRYADSHTNVAAGIERGLYELKERGRRGATPILIFITDGIVDTGSAAKDAEMREWLRTRLLPEAKARGVKIFGVALTEQADYALIQEMAAVTGGDYYRALGIKEVTGIFERIGEKLQAPPPPPPSSRPAPPPPPPPASVLTLAGFWVAVVAALTLILVGGLIAVRRGRRAATPAPPAPSPTATLVGKLPAAEPVPEAFLRDGRTGKRIRLLKARMRIGRAADNDIVVAEPQVSSSHAEIECRQGHFFLRDLRSTNGTWINKERLTGETVLKSGDVVAFDEFTFTFSAADAVSAGTMIRDVRDGAVVGEAAKPRPPAPPPPAPRPPEPGLAETAGFSGTVLIGTESTVDDSVASSRCAMHPSFEATERCDVCGKLWCALCNPPVSGERVCRTCRDLRKASGKRSGGRTDSPTMAG